MIDITEFAIKYWYLFAALAFFTLWLLFSDTLQRRKGIHIIDVKRAVRLLNDDSVQVYDLRPAKDYQNGYIAGAKNIDVNSLDSYVNEIKKGKKQPMLIDARGTNASGIAAKLKKLGIEKDIYTIAGGMMKWQEENMPLTKK